MFLYVFAFFYIVADDYLRFIYNWSNGIVISQLNILIPTRHYKTMAQLEFVPSSRGGKKYSIAVSYI